MGLDTVELVMEVEDVFGLSLSDAECERVQTVGQLHALVTSKLPTARTLRNEQQTADSCETRTAFQELRAVASAWPRFIRREVRPSTATRRVLRMSGQPIEAWQRLGEVSHAPLPELVHRPTAIAIMLGSGLLCCLCLVGCAALLGKSTPIALGLLGAAGICYLTTVLTSRLSPKDTPPVGCRSFGELARLIALRRVAGENTDATWMEIRRIVCEIAGVAPDRVQPETHIIHDLGID